MKDYRGTIIEESLKDLSVFKELEILSTHVSLVKETHKTPWLKQWTLRSVRIPEKEALRIAEKISRSFDEEHSSWYADYLNEKDHFIIFPNKIFSIDRNDAESYEKAKQYALSLGIPEYQCDFHPEIKEWERELL